MTLAIRSNFDSLSATGDMYYATFSVHLPYTTTATTLLALNISHDAGCKCMHHVNAFCVRLACALYMDIIIIQQMAMLSCLLAFSLHFYK